jgi:nicotinamide-nucleotide amidase
MPRVEILAVGSELLGTDRVDTNSLFLTGELNALGFEVVAKTVVGDHRARLVQAFRQAWQSADVVVSTGGLGPTEDDLTREAAGEALRLPLQHREELWEELQAKFARMGRPIPENNRRQAAVLQGADSLPNPRGTAPGQLFHQDGKVLVLLPGPPRELKPMMLDHVVPRLRPLGGDVVLRKRTLKIIGLGESALDERIAGLYRDRSDVTVTTLFTPLDLEVHLLAQGTDALELDSRLQALEDQVAAALGEHVYARSDVSLAEVVGGLLQQRGVSVATAESLTGGLLAQRISAVPGASAYFRGGFVAYTEALKQKLLGVRSETLAAHSAVSAETAAEMASGALQHTGADFALALTGYAGPDGGTEENPVGTVFIGIASAKGVQTRRLRFPGDRELVRSRAAQSALDCLRLLLSSN